MSLLKKIGMVAGNIAGIVAGVGPIASVMFPAQVGRIAQVEDVFQQVIGIIAQVEVVGAALQLTGAQKLSAAVVQIGKLVALTDLVRTHKIQDRVLYDKAIEGLAQSAVDLANSLGSSGVKVESQEA